MPAARSDRPSGLRHLVPASLLAVALLVGACAEQTVSEAPPGQQPVTAAPAPVAPGQPPGAAGLPGLPPPGRLDLGAPPPAAAPLPGTPAPPLAALLAPLSGRSAGLGSALVEGAQLAVFEVGDEAFRLRVYDSEGTPEGAARAASEAVADGAGIILGPLFAAEARAAAPVARQAGINVLTFSNDRSVAGDNLYVLGLLPRQQLARALAFAAGRGVARVGALVPGNPYGQAILEDLRAIAPTLGLTVTRAQTYDPEAEDLTATVRDFAEYSRRRAALLAQRQALEGRSDEISRAALRRLDGVETLGELPYDALVLPDGGQRLRKVAPLLAYFDVDSKKVRLLGTSLWDDPGLGAEPALVGGWYAAPPVEARAEFEARFAAAFGQKPPRLAAIAYDAAALAAVLARLSGQPDFGAEALTNPNGFAGVDGIFRLLPDGSTERGLAIYEVEPRGRRVIDPAPTTFVAPATN